MVSAPRRQGGMTYLAVLVAVAILGTAQAATGIVWRTARQHDNERELLFVGKQIRRAIEQYYQQTPGPVKQFPPRLEALLRDDRQPAVQRYLRRLYPDPITGRAQWGLVMAPQGGIAGVYSLSQATPLKQANFAEVDKAFTGAAKYSDWIFVYQPDAVPGLPPGTGQPGQAAPSTLPAFQ